MVWLRRVLTQGLAALLFIALLGGAYIISLNHTLGNASTVESSLRNSNAYDQIANYAITRATQSTSTPTGSVSLNDPQVKAIAQSVFSKQLVQQNAEIFINSNYRWLAGETPTPSFTIDVTGARQSFASQVNKTVFDYLSKLPVCTPAQLQQLLTAAIDPLTITCRPSAVIPKAEADRVSAQILSSDFLSQPVVTAETLKISGQPNQNKPYYVQFVHAPKVYQLTQKMPFVLGALALIAAAGIILISSTRRKGIRRVGLTFELAGLLLVATKYVSDTLFTKFQAKVFAGTTDATDVQKPLIDAGHQLEKQIVNTDFYLGIAFVVIGLILLVAYFRLRPGDKSKPAVPTAPVVPAGGPSVPVAPTPVAPISKPGKIHLATPSKGPTMDIARPKNQKPPGVTPVATKPPKPVAPTPTPSKKIQPRPRGRLIQ